MDLALLLAHADDQCPVLGDGVPLAAASQAPRPAPTAQPSAFRDDSGDPNNLKVQRWGVIAPEGPEGDRLLALIEPLRAARQEMQGGRPVQIFRVPAAMDLETASGWLRRVYWSDAIDPDDLPRYLLALGDLDQVSLDLQQLLAADTLIGRLAFRSDQGYEAYVAKLLRWEKAPPVETDARLLFYTALDGTAPTTIGHSALVAPSLAACLAQRDRGSISAREIAEIPYAAEGTSSPLLDAAAGPGPTALFTVSHGLGAPRGGWASVDLQRAQQGAMSLGGGQHLTGDDLGTKPFLPGGIWFFLACFGGATPAESAYTPWLSRLRDAGLYTGQLGALLSSLPKPGDRPFIAALPQAVLANPDGPLAVIAHADLAWTYSFQDMGAGVQDRPVRFQGIFRALLEGARAGCAHHELLRFFTEASVELSTLYDQAARAPSPPPADAARDACVANLWMLRQDLAAYLLLGDPAARLPLGVK